ncbi:hypothetical protein SLEP1_g7993 [Rubroshorea leprosula]|uniref:Uncharacterized protein n=1 Tax=Rubroshorea leprosula TaxID=152421 RepID=A0AAV5I8I2_9ROSI|nr:hypothetical protein SLEP1_g7993 [Rubroshorea leprosula]
MVTDITGMSLNHHDCFTYFLCISKDLYHSLFYG